jgi:hypothetical protein
MSVLAHFADSSRTLRKGREVPLPDLRAAAKGIFARLISSAKQLHVQSVEHGFSVRPSGNFVSELPHALSNCV